MNETKFWWQSKTIWINAIAFAAAVIGLLLEQSWLPAEVAGALVTVAAILNFILRFRQEPRKHSEPVVVPRRCGQCGFRRCRCKGGKSGAIQDWEELTE